MGRTKIDYGIDLGTTNSAISRIENGSPKIIKTDTLKDTLPSCIGFNKKQSILTGDSALNSLRSDRLRAMDNWSFETNFFIEFKRTMGQPTKYKCANVDREYSSEELSAEILKKLKSFIKDEELRSLVVTVPAKFQINQKDATVRAAKLAGIDHCELLQEPIAASMAYGLDSKIKDGFWLVFDFGGGTFDAALVKLEEGIMQVKDTEGDNYLGGKNLDYTIVDEIIIPWFKENYSMESILADDNKKKILQDAMKSYAEEAKIQLSFKESHDLLSDLGELRGEDDDGNEFELDIKVTHQDMERVLGPVFQKAIDITNGLLKRNNLSGKDLGSLILVGGPTFSPVLRSMLNEQIKKPDTSADPMTAVAEGAALYAATIDVSEQIREETMDKSKVQLMLKYESTTAEQRELVTIKKLPEKSQGEIPDKIFVEITRGDQSWSSGKVELGDMGELITVELNEGKPNSFLVLLYNDAGSVIPCEPGEFIIIQGTKLGSATLAYHIGIELIDRDTNRLSVYSIKGLEKNCSIPAIGVKNNLQTTKEVRPGNTEDRIVIPVYEMEHDADGSRAIHNQHVFDAIITGEDLPELLPEGSEMDLTVKYLKDGDIKLEAYFPLLDYTHEVKYDQEAGIQEEIDIEWLDEQISKATTSLNMIQQEETYDNKEVLVKLEKELADIKKRFEQGRADEDRKKDVLDSLRRVFRKLDDVEAASEWPKTEAELKDVFYKLEKINSEMGNEKTSELVEVFKTQIPEVIKSKDVRLAKKIVEDMRTLHFAIVSQDVQYWIGFVYYFNESFDTHDWSDPARARSLVDQGLQVVANNPTEQKIRPIIAELYRLLPGTDNEIPKNGPDGILTNRNE